MRVAPESLGPEESVDYGIEVESLSELGSACTKPKNFNEENATCRTKGENQTNQPEAKIAQGMWVSRLSEWHVPS